MQYQPNPKWSGEARIWLQELDLKAMKLVGARHDLWGGALLGALATEGPHIYPCPSLPTCRWPTTPACDHFDSPNLALQWNFLRTPSAESWSLSDRPGFLRLKLRPQTIMEKVHPSFVGRRQQHRNFTARAAMEFTPKHANECAGVVVLQNTNFMFRLEVTRAPSGDSMVRLIKRKEGTEETLCAQAIGPGRIYMKVEARNQDYSFWVSDAPDAWRPVIEKADGRILSTQVATGFVGAYIGMYASSNSQPGGNVADFDWFEYLPMDG